MNPTQIGLHSAWIAIFSDCSYCATAMSAGLSVRRDLSLSVATSPTSRRSALGGALLDLFATVRVALKHAESRSLVVERTRVGAVGFGVCAVKEEDRILFAVVRPGKRPADPAGSLLPYDGRKILSFLQPMALFLVQPNAKNVFRRVLSGLGFVALERHETHEATALVVGRSERDFESAGIVRPAEEQRLLLTDVVPFLWKQRALLLAFIRPDSFCRTRHQHRECRCRHDRPHVIRPAHQPMNAIAPRVVIFVSGS